MYSREEKISILEAFLESGLNAKQAGKRPGWPSRYTLKKWRDEAGRGELPVTIAPSRGHTMNRKRHEHYPSETKAEAVRLYERGRRPAQIAKLLGIDCSRNVRLWWKKANEEGRLPHDDFKPKPLPDERGETVAERKEVPPEVAALSEAELENACLRAVLADLKAGGWDPDSISNRKKVELGERLRAETGRALREIIGFLRISKSSYDYHRLRLDRPDKHALARKRMREIFLDSKRRYGYRPIWATLRREGMRVSEKVVRRIMKEEGLVVRYEPKAKRWSSYSGETSWAPPNLVRRDFRAGLPNFLWLTDITEFSFRAFKCYLSPVIDCFDGKVVSWSLSESPDAELANSMLDDAAATLRHGEKPMVHSDRGGHYRWKGWVARCREYGLTRSMSAKGCSPDNSACEGFFGRLKNELFHHRDWRNTTFEQFSLEMEDYIDWYNESRIKKSLGWMSPNEYRRSLGLSA